MTIVDNNHVLLIGNIYGALVGMEKQLVGTVGTIVEMVFDEKGNLTNQIRVKRASGDYLITVTKER